MVMGMEKVIYARVPDHVHDYITRQAGEAGLSMGAYVRRIILALMGEGEPPGPYSWQETPCPGRLTDGACTHFHVPGFLYVHETPDEVYSKLKGVNGE